MTTKQEITIRVAQWDYEVSMWAPVEKSMKVEAEMLHGWALHKAPGKDTWNVTHPYSGRMLVCGLSKAKAVAVVRALHKAGLDGSLNNHQVKVMRDEIFAAVRPLVPGYGEALV